MQRRVALDQNVLAGQLLEVSEPAVAVRLEHLHRLGMHAQHHVGVLKVLPHLAHLDVNLVADGGGALHHAGGLAGGAGHAEGPLQRLLDALARDRHQSEIVKLQHLGRRAVALSASSSAAITLKRFLRSSMSMKSITIMPPRSRRRIWRTISGTASRLVLTMVSSSRADLPTYLPVLMSMATSASVWLMTIDPPTLEPDLGAQRLRDLVLNAEVLEERRLLGVELDAPHQRGRKAVEEAHDALVVGLGVDPDVGEVGADLVAQDALDERQVVVDEGRRLGGFRALLDVVPKIHQEAQVGAELFFRRAFGGGAHDESARCLAALVQQNPLQAMALLVGGDLAADADVGHGGHEDQEAAGQRDVAGDARALLGDGLLGDLHQDLLAGLQQVGDDGQVGGLGRAARGSAASALDATATLAAAARSSRPRRSRPGAGWAPVVASSSSSAVSNSSSPPFSSKFNWMRWSRWASCSISPRSPVRRCVGIVSSS